MPLHPTPWPVGRAARVSVNSFGLGGANAHAIVEAAPAACAPAARTEAAPSPPALLVFSAKHAESLELMVRNCKAHLAKGSASLRNTAHTLACRREHMRAFVITDKLDFDDAAVAGASAPAAPAAPARVAMVFSGQGAQWPGMCTSLLGSFPAFARAIDKMDSVLQALAEPPDWTLRGECSPRSRQHCSDPRCSQASC